MVEENSPLNLISHVTQSSLLRSLYRRPPSLRKKSPIFFSEGGGTSVYMLDYF